MLSVFVCVHAPVRHHLVPDGPSPLRYRKNSPFQLRSSLFPPLVTCFPPFFTSPHALWCFLHLLHQCGSSASPFSSSSPSVCRAFTSLTDVHCTMWEAIPLPCNESKSKRSLEEKKKIKRGHKQHNSLTQRSQRYIMVCVSCFPSREGIKLKIRVLLPFYKRA